jgi:AraC-like DNA-binding protein
MQSCGYRDVADRNWKTHLISVRTTEFSGADSVRQTFESNMFSRTNAFSLSSETGRIRVETAELSPGGLRVSRVLSTGHLVDLTEETAATVLFPAAGQLRVRVAAAEYRIGPKAVCIFGPNARRTRAEAPTDARLFQANALMIPNHALRNLLQAGRDRDAGWPALPDSLPLAATLPEARRLSDLLGYLTRQFDDRLPLSTKAGAAMAVLIEEFLSDLILRSAPPLTDARALPAAWARVRMAEEIMRARSDEPLSMAEVAREVGVGLRSLQLAFIETRAMGPRDVLLRMRLERAREALLAARPTDSVTGIAMDCGFAHLGRFPAAYRTAFGELPTETLARARRRAS